MGLYQGRLKSGIKFALKPEWTYTQVGLYLGFYSILLYNFLVTHLKFMKFCGFFKNLSGINILIFFFFFFQNSNCFLQCQHFFMSRCYFFCMSSVEIVNISLTILVVFESRRFRKSFC